MEEGEQEARKCQPLEVTFLIATGKSLQSFDCWKFILPHVLRKEYSLMDT
jgi:hypothetical protein